MTIAASELILGGQKSGKSRRAEELAAAWLAQGAAHRAVLVATAEPHDDEMRARIARHQRDRAQRAPGLTTIEASAALPAAVYDAGGAETLRIVDCLTLWLLQEWLPQLHTADAGAAASAPLQPARPLDAIISTLEQAVAACPGPLVLVSNEIGAGVIPLGQTTRAFVDALGTLNQAAARACGRVTLMVAGLPLCVKGAP